MPYQDGLQIQQEWLNGQNGELPVILGFEHPAIITLGIRGTVDDIISAEFPVHRVDRGGQATLHNPGQLVIYPIFDLNCISMTVRQFVESMLETTSATLRECNITIQSQKDGVFTRKGKIASAGFNIKQKKTSHGLAINICNDLSAFRSIKACGISQPQMDKVSHYSKEMTPELFFKLWEAQFKRD